MNRIYEGTKTDGVTFFVGPEVEHTPLYGVHTLFVVGIQPIEEILALAKEHNVEAIYFGTATSFNPTSENDIVYDAWDSMIMATLDAGYWATLDFDVWHSPGVHKMQCAKHNKFVPMISVKIGYVRQFNNNATLKIDDIDFDKSNPGVWSWPMNELLKRNKFTHWSVYVQDKIIK